MADASCPGCVAQRSHTTGILASRALRDGRLDHLGASLYLCPRPLNPCVKCALGEIDGLGTFRTGVVFMEFIGKNLFGCSALGAFADERF